MNAPSPPRRQERQGRQERQERQGNKESDLLFSALLASWRAWRVPGFPTKDRIPRRRVRVELASVPPCLRGSILRIDSSLGIAAPFSPRHAVERFRSLQGRQVPIAVHRGVEAADGAELA